MLTVTAGPLPTETSPVSPQIVIRRQKGGPKCNPNTALRQRLTLYGLTVTVPNILEDKLIRSLIQKGKSLYWAYWAVGFSDLIPPWPLMYCAEKVFESGLPGSRTCTGFLDCLQWHLEETGRLVVPEAGRLPVEPVPAEPLPMEPLPVEPLPVELEPIPPVVIVPGLPTGPPAAWVQWIESVAPFVSDIPPPQTPLVRADGLPGPPQDWLEWMRMAAARVPQLPPPEPIPGMELPPAQLTPVVQEPAEVVVPPEPGLLKPIPARMDVTDGGGMRGLLLLIGGLVGVAVLARPR